MDWKATAKSGSLKVREFAREDERKLCIVFDNPAAGAISEQAYENAVNLAASLAWHFSEEEEAEVSFLIPGLARSRELHEFLARLAVIEPGGPAARSVDALQEINAGSTGGYNIVLTARPRGSLPTPLWNSSYFVFLGEEKTSSSLGKVSLRG